MPIRFAIGASTDSVYILSQRGATDEASRWLAERENASDLIGGVSLDDKDNVLASVLLDLSQSASLSASQVAAERVLRQLNRVGEVRKPQVQQARFMVLKSPDIPSMLVETAYISNPQEELRLRGSAHQAKLAAAIHQGVHDYFYANPPAGTRSLRNSPPALRRARRRAVHRRRLGRIAARARCPNGACPNSGGPRPRPRCAENALQLRGRFLAHPTTVRCSHRSNRRRRGDQLAGVRGQGTWWKTRSTRARHAHRGGTRARRLRLGSGCATTAAAFSRKKSRWPWRGTPP